MRIFSTYLVPTDPLTYSDELKDMFNKWPDAARYPNQGIVVFASVHPQTFEPVDATLLTDDEDGVVTATQKLLNLIQSHTGESPVLVSREQVKTIHNILHISEEETI